MFQRLKALGRDLAVYGAGDVATQAISFLLLPVYVRFLSPGDYGVLALLLMVEMLAKILFRWGVDSSFMRMYYDCPDQPARRLLASTIFLFLLAANGAVLAVALDGRAQPLARHLFGSVSQAPALQILLVNTFLAGFFFIPFHELRIQRQSGRFIALTVTRSLATIVLRLTLVIGFRLGVLGVVLADLITTVLFGALMLPRFLALVGPVFSPRLLREALRFGLPRLPHGARAADGCGLGPLRPEPLRDAARARPLLHRRVVCDGPQALPQCVRVRVGSVLLRDHARARRQAHLPAGRDLGRRGAGRAGDAGCRRRAADRAHHDDAAVSRARPASCRGSRSASCCRASTC